MSSPQEPTPERFYQRFNNGELLSQNWPRITTRGSEAQFPSRDAGLDLLLINAPIREWSYPNIMPLGQGYVASVAKMDGHKIHVLDINAERKEPVTSERDEFLKWVFSRVEETVGEVKPDVIGISGIVTQYGLIKEITALCRKLLPEVTIILAGGVGSCMPAFMLERMPIDLVVQEEGEVTASEVLHRLELNQSMEGVKGVVYKFLEADGTEVIKDNGLRTSIGSEGKGMDGLPWPLRSAWPIDEVYKKNPVGHLNWKAKWNKGAPTDDTEYSISIISARGCPYAVRACDYCYAAYLGKTYRLRGPQDLADEMEYLQEEYGAEYIHFLDDLSLTDFRWALRFYDILREKEARNGFKITWGASCRTNIIAADIDRAIKQDRPNIIEQAYEVGMRQVVYGVETGSPTILKSIDKSGQTPDRIKLAITETKRVMGYADCSFMIGSPNESKKTIEETVELCREIGLQPEVFFFTTAYPATTFWQLALDKGLIRKAVTGEAGPADDDIIEQYLQKLGEQGDEVRTNFSDMPDEEVIALSWWAVKELGAQNVHRHPGSGDFQELPEKVAAASDASL